jgi:hypothetical protein
MEGEGPMKVLTDLYRAYNVYIEGFIEVWGKAS